MIHSEKINSILEYIEKNIDLQLTVDLLSSKAGLSRFHFHRIFKALIGLNPMEYIEKQRVKRAAFDLVNEKKKKVIDIAFDYGFQSHESFIRTFKKNTGMTPSQFRKEKLDINIRYFDKLGSLDLKLSNGKVIPNPKIVTQKAFTIACIKYKGNDIDAVDLLWQEFWKLRNHYNINSCYYFGVCLHDLDMRNKEVFDYYAGYESSLLMTIPKEMNTLEIPAEKYAQFTHKGSPEKIGLTYDQIYYYWLPFTNCIPTMNMDMIRVDKRFDRDENSEIDIFIPIN
ncbi:AraC family transcriptional regulator [Sediminispirochaeta bajacaliforniensis]|uniref:AraC family transcriptional regulator n=1 Tax=Sediminispirochaeta bajacaliforniensis TaxID=148 RepID=UPI000366372B|nr:AraC family transcriptional regulator [Sediminispirochaeta bajacaliforniensis]